VSRRSNPTESDFQSVLRDGLSSSRSYVLLREKSRSPAYLCFKPFVQRLNDAVIYLGGKLSIFADEENEKWQGLSEPEQQELLSKAWRKLPQDRVGGRRIGSNAGFLVAAGGKDQESFLSKFDKGHLIKVLLDSIEEELKVEIDNRDEVTGYLSLFYHQHIPSLFNSWSGSKNLPPRTIGKKSEILIGQSYVNGGSAIGGFMEQYDLVDATMEDDAA